MLKYLLLSCCTGLALLLALPNESRADRVYYGHSQPASVQVAVTTGNVAFALGLPLYHERVVIAPVRHYHGGYGYHDRRFDRSCEPRYYKQNNRHHRGRW